MTFISQANESSFMSWSASATSFPVILRFIVLAIKQYAHSLGIDLLIIYITLIYIRFYYIFTLFQSSLWLQYYNKRM